MTKQSKPPSHCPVCGAEVPAKARACPECGADERAGWDEEATRYDDLNLPDAAFEESEPGRPRRVPSSREATTRPAAPPHPLGMRGVWWIVGVVVLCAMVYFAVKSGF